jgi:hypothetical protein
LLLLGLAILGEYIAKIVEEVKRRPLFIRRCFIKDGEARAADDHNELAKSSSDSDFRRTS